MRLGDVVERAIGLQVVIGLEQVVAEAAPQGVLTGAADDPVVAGVAEDDVVAVGADRGSRQAILAVVRQLGAPGDQGAFGLELVRKYWKGKLPIGVLDVQV